MEFLPLLLSIFLLSAGVASASDAVLDVEGNELKKGELYYAESIIWGAGEGGLKLASLKESCPKYVVKSHFGDPTGQALAFFPENPRDDTIREGNTLYAMFVVPNGCPQSTVWKLDAETGYVSTGGTTSKAIGPHDSRFAIVKAQPGSSHPFYQFQPCPCSVGSGLPSCRMACGGGLGLGEEGDKTPLTIHSNSPHIVMFVKVKGGAARESMLRFGIKRSMV